LLKEKCETFREIELSNILLEELIINKHNKLKLNKKDKTIFGNYQDLILMRDKLFDRNVRKRIFELSNIIWRD